MPDQPGQHKRRWRFYRTASGHEPVREFILQLSRVDQAAIAGAMKDAEREGLQAARHLQGDIYEVRASGAMQNFRILFAPERHYNQILLALEAFSKKTQKTPPREIALAESRLRDWRHHSNRP
jgi:phage-related protein